MFIHSMYPLRLLRKLHSNTCSIYQLIIASILYPIHCILTSAKLITFNMSLINAVLSNPQVPEAIRQAALDRAHSSAGLPIEEGRTESFWLKEPHPTAAQAQSGALPEKVDVAIIGSGITGLSVAWTILQTAKQRDCSLPSVVILEARDACSGATGRNGGHVLETVLEYLEFKQLFGKDAAMKLIRFRLGHMLEMEALMKDRPELRERSQLRKVEFVSVYFDEETFQTAVKSLEEFKKDMPEESQGFASHRGEKLQTVSHKAQLPTPSQPFF